MTFAHGITLGPLDFAPLWPLIVVVLAVLFVVAVGWVGWMLILKIESWKFGPGMLPIPDPPPKPPRHPESGYQPKPSGRTPQPPQGGSVVTRPMKILDPPEPIRWQPGGEP